MTRVLHRPRADEALIPVATSRPAPIAPSAPLPAKRAHAAEVLRELRAADTSWAALGMRQPVAPQLPAPRPLPGIATIAYLSAVSVAIRVDQALHADTLHVIDDIRALLDGRPELLAPFADAVKAGEAS